MKFCVRFLGEIFSANLVESQNLSTKLALMKSLLVREEGVNLDLDLANYENSIMIPVIKYALEVSKISIQE